MADQNKIFIFTGTKVGLSKNLKGLLKAEPELNGITKGSISKKKLDAANVTLEDLLNKEIKVKLVDLNPQKNAWLLELYEPETIATEKKEESKLEEKKELQVGDSIIEPTNQPEKSCMPKRKTFENVEDVSSMEDKEEKIISSFEMVDVPSKGKIKPFKIAKYVVVQKLYKEVMGKNPSHFDSGDESRKPVENITWEEAIVFCNKLSETSKPKLEKVYFKERGEWKINETANGYRLPTREEWLLAAKDGIEKSPNSFSGSLNNPQEVAWWQGDNPTDETHEVGDLAKKPNALDIYDMSGNVWEWCWGDNGSHIRCGGAFNSSEEEISLDNSKNVKYEDAMFKSFTTGFRLARGK